MDPEVARDFPTAQGVNKTLRSPAVGISCVNRRGQATKDRLRGGTLRDWRTPGFSRRKFRWKTASNGVRPTFVIVGRLLKFADRHLQLSGDISKSKATFAKVGPTFTIVVCKSEKPSDMWQMSDGNLKRRVTIHKCRLQISKVVLLLPDADDFSKRRPTFVKSRLHFPKVVCILRLLDNNPECSPDIHYCRLTFQNCRTTIANCRLTFRNVV